MKILVYFILCFFAGCGIQYTYQDLFPKYPRWIGLILAGILGLFSGWYLV